MPSTVLLIVAVAAGACAAAIAVFAVAVPVSPRERVLRILEAFGSARGRTARVRDETSVGHRVGAAFTRASDRFGHALTPEGTRQRLIRLLDYAGYPAQWPIERVVRLRGQLFVLVGVGLGAFGNLVAGRLGAVLGLIAGLILGLFMPDMIIWNRGKDRQEDLVRSMPDVLDGLVIGVEAGLGLDAAMAQVTQNLEGPLPDEIHRVLQEMKIGVARGTALRALADRTTVRELRSFVNALVQSGELGVPVAGVLREHAREQRVKRRQRAEEQAQKVPVKLLFPVLFFIFPAIFVVILGPGILRLVDQLGR